MKKNRGYTLIEVIIVIAIIAILSGVSFVTIGIIKNAKAQAAATTLSDQMGSLLIKTRALSEAKDSRLCLRLRYNENRVEYADGTIARAGSYSLILGYHDGSSFIEKNPDMAEATLPDSITIDYAPAAANQESGITGLGDKDVIIEFNKSNGSVRHGAGNYTFRLNDSIMSYVVLDATTGNHYVTGKVDETN